ncbi:hypothetical protein MIR68_003484 [Amoeboaphelidium protococcarum]|nr:hypothetical protein MIR68_003484 [Amoeboaphelidium protococcarum]
MVNNAQNQGEDDMDFLGHMMATKGTDWQPLSEDNWAQEMDQIPLFMSNKTSPADMKDNPQLQAFQQLMSDDLIEGETVQEVVERWKVSGNEIFVEAKKEFKQKNVDASKYRQYLTVALEKYGKGIALLERDDNRKQVDILLTMQIYSNRAAVHLELQNYKSCILDSGVVIKTGQSAATSSQICEKQQLDNSLLKACYRYSKATLALQKFEESKQCILFALSLVNESQRRDFTALMQEADKQYNRYTLEQQSKLQKSEALQQKQNQILEAFRGKKINLQNAQWLRQQLCSTELGPQTLSTALFTLPAGFDYKPDVCSEVDLNQCSLMLPIIIVYPLPSRFDVLQCVDEQTRWVDLLEEVLADRDDFDFEGSSAYKPQSVSLYVPLDAQYDRVMWSEVSTGESVLNACQRKRFTYPEDGVLRIWLLPALDSQYGDQTQEWLKSYQAPN